VSGRIFWIKKFTPPYSNNLIIADLKEPKTRINDGVFALFKTKKFRLISEFVTFEI
jgi:hypothetical protein